MAKVASEYKEGVAQAFSKAAKHYDQHARFQRQVGRVLLSHLPEDLTGWRLVDLGCGTGYFTHALALRGAEVLAIDISAAMLERCRARCAGLSVQYLQADAEKLPDFITDVDVIFSNLALQWCEDIDDLIPKLLLKIKPQGVLLWSTLLEGSLNELKSAWQQVGSTYQHINHFQPYQQIQQAIASLQAQQKFFEQQAITCWYSSALALMKDLKGIGATHGAGRGQGLTTPQRLKQVEKAYQDIKAENNLLPATYQVGFGVLQR
ncbi:malonyl-ACP O-methyltransferase BioC [Vibrio aphrogenes]|uniref:malonyl-ACP O-methyltransferase BioC n=1 Tax=Vibrio aphrogenes TaxID=1891186 RepID=UPI000B35D10D|nr:malonyl-ACP O-methyltransferase BioC [Vibrio aphrogenes]